MMGTRSPQGKLFAADQIYLDYVGRASLHRYLALNWQHLFRDEDFAALYCTDNGRTSVPPSLAISLLFLRATKGEFCRGGRAQQLRSGLEGGAGVGDGRSAHAEEHPARV
jgi:hypothetical protein